MSSRFLQTTLVESFLTTLVFPILITSVKFPLIFYDCCIEHGLMEQRISTANTVPSRINCVQVPFLKHNILDAQLMPIDYSQRFITLSYCYRRRPWPSNIITGHYLL